MFLVKNEFYYNITPFQFLIDVPHKVMLKCSKDQQLCLKHTNYIWNFYFYINISVYLAILWLNINCLTFCSVSLSICFLFNSVPWSSRPDISLLLSVQKIETYLGIRLIICPSKAHSSRCSTHSLLPWPMTQGWSFYSYLKLGSGRSLFGTRFYIS